MKRIFLVSMKTSDTLCRRLLTSLKGYIRKREILARAHSYDARIGFYSLHWNVTLQRHFRSTYSKEFLPFPFLFLFLSTFLSFFLQDCSTAKFCVWKYSWKWRNFRILIHRDIYAIFRSIYVYVHMYICTYEITGTFERFS